MLNSASSITPFTYFGYTKDFDYRKYLEERSHHELVVLAVDEATQNIVGSAELIAKNIGIGAEAISTGLNDIGDAVKSGTDRIENKLDSLEYTVSNGFDALSIGLEDIDTSIVNLSSVCEIGFESLNSSIMQSNELLSELVDLTKTPDQVWAKEQYENALHCVEIELWEDAIDYCTKAIEGDELHSGYKLEPSFHFLRGSIYLGGKGIDFGLLDLKKAYDDFSNCTKYCGKDPSYRKQKALTNAGWAKYCDGRSLEAIDLLKQATDMVEHVPQGSLDMLESFYLLAKTYLHIGKKDEAKKSLRIAIFNNEMYAYRSVNDPDFIKHIDDVHIWLEEWRSEWARQATESLNEEVQPETLEQLVSLAKTEEINFPHADEILVRIAALRDPKVCISELIQFRHNRGKYLINGQGFIPVIRESLKESLNLIEDKADKLLHAATSGIPTKKEAKKNTSLRDDKKDRYTMAGMFLLPIIAVIWNYNVSKELTGLSYFMQMVFGSILLIIVSGIVGMIIGRIIGGIIGASQDSSRMQNENIVQGQERKKAMEKRDLELEEIKIGKDHGRKLKNMINDLREKLQPIFDAA